MNKNTAKNIFWGIVLVVILLIASHYDYKYQIEDMQAQEDCRAAMYEE